MGAGTGPHSPRRPVFHEEEHIKGTPKQIVESYERLQVSRTGHPLPPAATYREATELFDDVSARGHAATARTEPFSAER